MAAGGRSLSSMPESSLPMTTCQARVLPVDDPAPVTVARGCRDQPPANRRPMTATIRENDTAPGSGVPMLRS